jgi:hypothetical protein
MSEKLYSVEAKSLIGRWVNRLGGARLYNGKIDTSHREPQHPLFIIDVSPFGHILHVGESHIHKAGCVRILNPCYNDNLWFEVSPDKIPDDASKNVNVNIQRDNKDYVKTWNVDNKKMRDLIGRYVIRTNPMIYNGRQDSSYMDEILFIKDVRLTDHIKYKVFDRKEGGTLNPRWNDDKWCEVPNLWCAALQTNKDLICAYVTRTDPSIQDIIYKGDYVTGQPLRNFMFTDKNTKNKEITEYEKMTGDDFFSRVPIFKKDTTIILTWEDIRSIKTAEYKEIDVPLHSKNIQESSVMEEVD